MRHPEPDGPPDRTPIKVGEVWENPVTGERATILELPWDNQAGRVTAELTALVGARVVGEQRAIFGAIAPIAHWRGYRATYPQLSRTVLAPRM